MFIIIEVKLKTCWITKLKKNLEFIILKDGRKPLIFINHGLASLHIKTLPEGNYKIVDIDNCNLVIMKNKVLDKCIVEGLGDLVIQSIITKVKELR